MAAFIRLFLKIFEYFYANCFWSGSHHYLSSNEMESGWDAQQPKKLSKHCVGTEVLSREHFPHFIQCCRSKYVHNGIWCCKSQKVREIVTKKQQRENEFFLCINSLFALVFIALSFRWEFGHWETNLITKVQKHIRHLHGNFKWCTIVPDLTQKFPTKNTKKRIKKKRERERQKKRESKKRNTYTIH